MKRPTKNKARATHSNDEIMASGKAGVGDSLLPKVVQWDEDYRAFLRTVLERTADKDEPFPTERVYLAERLIELLLDERFREEYQRLLAEYPAVASGRFMASDPKAGRKFIQDLGIIEVIPVPNSSNPPGFPPGHTFPLPTVHHRSRGARRSGARPDNIRLLLSHIGFLRWHPVYLLVCTQCGWPQGALGRAESYASDVPYPEEQVANWWRATSKDRRRDDEELELLVDAIRREFSEEVWGFDVIKRPPHRESPSQRHAVSGEIARVLDYLMDLTGFPDGFPEVLLQEARARQARTTEALGLILGQLECQVCARPGAIRYMPRFLLPLDADLSSTSQSEFAAYLSNLFDEARARIRKDSRMADVLWIPKRFPRMRLSELAQRFELRHEDRIERAKREPNLWLVAMWLIDISSASARRTVRSRRKSHKSGDTRMTWSVLFDELGLNPRGQGDLDQDMNRLRIRVDRLVAPKKKQHHHLLISRVRILLEDPSFSEAAKLLARYYLEEVLQKKIDELKRNPQ